MSQDLLRVCIYICGSYLKEERKDLEKMKEKKFCPFLIFIGTLLCSH